MRKTLENTVKGALSARAARLAFLRSVLDGTMYDALKYDFHEERTSGGEYIPIAKRRPSVRYNLCRLVVEDSISLLFGNGRFPSVACTDAEVAATLKEIIAETGLCQIMQDAAFKGSVGSVAVLMRVLEERVFFEVIDTSFLTPIWNPKAPDTLLRVVEKYQVKGNELADMGYDIAPDEISSNFWFQRVWDAEAETWYLPWRVWKAGGAPEAPPVPDNTRTVQHNLGFVPLVWIKNLRGGAGDVDGCCTFEPAIDNQIELEYQLSQGGRGLKYSSDPMLLIKEPPSASGPVVRSSSTALVIDKEGDAKLLEINGTAVGAVIEYVRALRELAIESIHGNRSNADKVSAAQSGRALEMMHQSLIWLADNLRTSYGECGLLPLLQMVMRARAKMPLKLYGELMPSFPAGTRIKLNWPQWFHATERDKGDQTSRVVQANSAGLISDEQAVTVLADANGVADVASELTKIAGDTATKDQRAKALGAQVKASETLPA